MEDVSTHGGSLKNLLDQSYKLFADGAFRESEKFLEEALAIDFDDRDVLSSLKCSNFWASRSARAASIEDPLEKGEYLLKEWRVFDSFSRGFLGQNDQGLLSLKQWVFGSALASYKAIQRDNDEMDREILFRLGRCYKALGDYENGLALLEMSNNRKREDPEILAELADAYALVNEIKAAKIFFREAFFIDPQKVDLLFLESEMIRRLVDRLREKFTDEVELKEWVPVYGIIYGILNVKRELKPLEYGKLRQSIYSLENEVQSGHSNREDRTIPRLLNRYLWLVDHYLINNEPRAKVEEILEKIKILNNSIYEQYIQ